MNDRIRLAEAMGWKFDHQGPPPQDFGCPTAFYWINPDGERKLTHRSGYGKDGYEFPQGGADLFLDPFTDANDDYAVLEWRRTFNIYEYLMEHDDRWVWFVAALDASDNGEGHKACYKIGDYARAALRVLAAQEPETSPHRS